MTRDKIEKEKYSAVFNSAVADKNRRIAEIKTPQKLPAIRYSIYEALSNDTKVNDLVTLKIKIAFWNSFLDFVATGGIL